MFGGGSVVGSGADGDVVAALAIVGEGVGFVVVSGESPAGGEGGVVIGRAVAIGVGGFGELGHLGDADLVFGDGVDAAAVVKSGGEVLPVPVVGIG